MRLGSVLAFVVVSWVASLCPGLIFAFLTGELRSRRIDCGELATDGGHVGAARTRAHGRHQWSKKNKENHFEFPECNIHGVGTSICFVCFWFLSIYRMCRTVDINFMFPKVYGCLEEIHGSTKVYGHGVGTSIWDPQGLKVDGSYTNSPEAKKQESCFIISAFR